MSSLKELVACKRWLTVAAGLTLGLAASFAQAAICTVNDPLTNPDAFVEASSSCGAGLGQNPSDAALDTVIGPNAYVQADKDDPPLNTADEGFLLTGTLLGGLWFIDTDVDNADTYIIALKDGNIAGADYSWYWFIVDQDASELADNVGNCAATAPAGFDLCGTWGMYGDGGNAKELSHVELWITGQTITVPEPGTILLLGLGLVGLGLARRRRQV